MGKGFRAIVIPGGVPIVWPRRCVICLEPSNVLTPLNIEGTVDQFSGKTHRMATIKMSLHVPYCKTHVALGQRLEATTRRISRVAMGLAGLPAIFAFFYFGPAWLPRLAMTAGTFLAVSLVMWVCLRCVAEAFYAPLRDYPDPLLRGGVYGVQGKILLDAVMTPHGFTERMTGAEVAAVKLVFSNDRFAAMMVEANAGKGYELRRR
ncbi:MAG: hypothetical protein U0166_00435 [Acidobacteriota bacterium]